MVRSGDLSATGSARDPAALVFLSTELKRSTREREFGKQEELGKLRVRIADAEDADERDDLERELSYLVDDMLKRNVTVYGAINLRTNGSKAVFAYKLERDRKIGRALPKWDIYTLGREGNGPITYTG